MNKIITFGFVISFLFGISGFVASNNIFVGIAIIVIGILYFVLLARPIYSKYCIKVSRYHECYHFINTFIVSLSIKASLAGAYETAVESMPEDFYKNIENVETFTLWEKLEYLNKYFRFHTYMLFLDLLHLYEEQGGNILEMSSNLLDEVRLTEEYISYSETTSRKKLGEFAILWLLTLGIMIFMRFALSEFFNTISKQLFYPIGIFAILFFALLTIHLAILRMCKLEIRGWNDSEKV